MGDVRLNYRMGNKNTKGHFCWLCGSLENITAHHLKTSQIRTKKVREELGILLYNGEVIPVCRKCHDKIEEAKVIVNSMKSRKAAYKRGYEKGVEDLSKP